MQRDQHTIERLTEFKLRDKFSVESWSARGLNPSHAEFSGQLTGFFNDCADELIRGARQGNSQRKQKSILRSALANLNKHSYDTEEREFICHLFYELANSVGINFSDDLNKWLDGSFLVGLLKIQRFLRPDRIVRTISRPCTKCGGSLDILVLKRGSGIPDHSWLVVKCSACSELNLLSPGPDIKAMRYGNFQQIDSLPKHEYTLEQALVRLEQIRVFRKF